MHIISGLYKNTPILSPEDEKTHPMGSREKLAMFNMLSSYLPSSVVLDAYAGSGALGLEAISRGASKVIFVEHSPKIAKTLKRNIEKVCSLDSSAENKAELIIRDVSKLDLEEKSFDIIIADPPYNNINKKDIESLVKYLKSNGIFVLSSPRNEDELLGLPGMDIITDKYYSSAKITLFKKS